MPRRISNSEVGSWLACRNQYRYAFDLDLEPIKLKDTLARGTVGHEILAVYYKTLQDGATHDEAVVTARRQLQYLMAGESDYSLDIIMDVDRVLQMYWAFWGRDKWEILAVEQDYELPLNGEYSMPMRLDLLVRDIATGERWLLDHKFFYDLPNQDKLALNVQLPKYVGALRFNNHKVDKAFLNVLRYRKLKNATPADLFKRVPVAVSNAKIMNALTSHILASEEITEYRSLPTPEDRKAKAIPVFHPLVCQYCSFINLCSSEYDGGDISYAIKTQYRKNSYGYNNPESTVSGDL